MRWVGGVRCLGHSPKKTVFLTPSLNDTDDRDDYDDGGAQTERGSIVGMNDIFPKTFLAHLS